MDQFLNENGNNTNSNDNYEQLLKAMGFDDENAIKQALSLSNNDINEAVAILTNEKLPKITSLVTTTNSSSSTNSDNDVLMADANNLTLVPVNDDAGSSNPLEFPVRMLGSLESTLFTDNWSIPYKREESLGRLLTSTIALLREGLAELDVNCKQFLDRFIPEVYKKLLDSAPVNKWNAEIQQGVYNMTCMVVELIAIRLGQTGVPEPLLTTLALIFNSDNMFHSKNIHKVWDRAYYQEKLGNSNLFTINLDTMGWLLNFINIFGLHKGFDALKCQLEKTNDMHEFNLLLKPVATCCQFLNRELIVKEFEPSFQRIFDTVKKLDKEDFKDKNVGKVFDLLLTMKKLSASLWPLELDKLHELHLNVVLHMLKYHHFNSKMNSLKELCKLIETMSSSTIVSKTMIKEEKLYEWIITQRILSLAVEGNIDQVQYCEKIKTIVEFIADRIRNEEISALWNMQFNKSMSIIENLYKIIGIAATKFSTEQLEYLLEQIIQTWNNPSFKLHDKLVGLLSMIGRDARSNKTCSKILEALWELKNRPGLTRPLLLLIYSEHLNVLNGGRLPRETAKREYIKKCCDDIKMSAGSSIAIASLRHMYEIMNSFSKNTNKLLKEILDTIVVPIMKNLCSSLVKCHANAYEKAKNKNQVFDQTALIDDVFSHEEVVQTHLNSMRFILKEGNLYLNLNRAQEIWDVLITNEHSCDWDKQIGFEWFIDCWGDLNDESRCEIFKKQVLKLQAAKLSPKGYECFKLYFIRVNELDNKIQTKNDNDFVVEKLDLIGLNYLWDIILYALDEKIADMATKFLLEVLYEKVSSKLRREIVQLHQRFINECYTRLENCLVTLDSSPIGQVLLNAFRITYASVSMNDLDAVPIATRNETYKCIERLLMVAERYIVTVEENNSITRTFLPHFQTFKSETFTLSIHSENKAPIDLFVCSNDTLSDLRLKIANLFNYSASNLQLYHNDKLISITNDSKLIGALNIDGSYPICVKFACSYPPSVTQTPIKDSINFNYTRIDVELEKSFPGVLIANGGLAFDMLYRLEDLNEPNIRTRVRNILKLIPTNPSLLDAFDRIIGKMGVAASAIASSSSSSSSNIERKLKKSPSASSMTLSSSSSPTFSSTMTISNETSAAATAANNMDLQTSTSSPPTPTYSNVNQITGASTLANVTSSAVAAVSSFFGTKKADSTSSLDGKCATYAPAKDFSKFFAKSLPPHRILYHLETLSSKLIPASSLDVQQSADQFQADFLKSNGLDVLISLLKSERIDSQTTTAAAAASISSIEYETKQDIYILLLQLLRLVFFGSIYPSTSSNCSTPSMTSSCVNKRPSSEPIATSCAAKKTITQSMVSTSIENSGSGENPFSQPQMSNFMANADEIVCTDSKVASVLEKMSTSEIVDLIVQFLIIFWSASAGNLYFIEKDGSLSFKLEGDLKSSPSSSSSMVVNVSAKSLAYANDDLSTIASDSNFTISDSKSSLNDLQRAPEPQQQQQHQQQIEMESSGAAPLSSSNRVQKEVKFFIQDHRLSTGSNMSTNSMDSNDTQPYLTQSSSSSYLLNANLQSGICIKQTNISTKDVKIASKAIELITCFVLYRKDCLSTLLGMKLFNECIVDVLTGSISSEIRASTEKFLLKLFVIETPTFKCKDHLMNLIIKARLPLWTNSSMTRVSTQKLIAQSSQYFNLRCAVLENLTIEEQSNYGIDLKKMLGDEVNWIIYFTPTKILKDIDNVLLTGHLCLVRALLTCETANKADVGAEVIPQLIQSYLFPASYLLNNPSDDCSMEPICSTESSRLAAYRLLVELSKNCISNFTVIASQLIKFHHSPNPLMANEWNYIPLVTPRADCGFVGLKNGGATCYMNAVLQQLFMMPGITDYLLGIEDETDKKSIFCQLQNVFAHLKESKLEYYGPESFWKAFKMWGQEVNVREQQDAFDFFISMTDQIDEHLKKIKKEPIFKKIFGGTFSNQFICKDCPHRYEREEAYLGLNLPVKAGNLQESLLQFVKDELLDGDNSYNCEECGEKRSAIKRTCIKKLPKYLCIQLKRFDYDWESNRALKFDDYFQFPTTLDVSPYMYESINNRQQREQTVDQSRSPVAAGAAADPENKLAESITENCQISQQQQQQQQQQPMDVNNEQQQQQPNASKSGEIIYELVGIVVHSGQANAGHYYSFVKGSKRNYQSNYTVEQEMYELEQLNQSVDESHTRANNETQKSLTPHPFSNTDGEEKWYKFNDTFVEEINLNEMTLIEECFGGTFTQSSDYKLLPEERVRYWNAYMLFYKEVEKMPSAQQRQFKPKQRREYLKNMNSGGNTGVTSTGILHDSLSELAELVSKGDEKGIFRTGLPASIEQIVKAENLEFCKNRGIYDLDYFQFIYDLVRIFKEDKQYQHQEEEMENSSRVNEFIAPCCNLGLEFLYNTLFKTGKKLRNDLAKWLDLFRELLASHEQAASTMLSFIVNREVNSGFIRHYMLECPIVDIREACSLLFEYCTNSLVLKFGAQVQSNQKLTSLMNSCVQLLDKAVIDLCKNSSEYFRFLYVYANMTRDASYHLVSLGVFSKLICFLLGNPGKAADDVPSRRWSAVQTREFAIVYEIIATLVLKCNILAFKSCDIPATVDVGMENVDAPSSSTTTADVEEIKEQLDDIDTHYTSTYATTTTTTTTTFTDGNPFVQKNEMDSSRVNEFNSSSCRITVDFSFVPPKSTSELMPIPQEMQIYLFGVLSTRYTRELVTAFELINQQSLHRTLEMVLTCCYCNESFSANMIHQILAHIKNSPNEIKHVLNLLNHIILIEDPLQSARLGLALDGYKDNDVTYSGLLSIVRQNQSSDAKKSYQCVKFIVTLANNTCKEYLLKTASNWEWSVNWLKDKMLETLGSSNYRINWPSTSSSQMQSNDDSENRSFQRTKSAQRTLDDATALLKSNDLNI